MTMIPTIDRVRTGRRLKKLMIEKGLTVCDIKEYLSLGSVQSVYHWFYGKSMPSIDNLYALSVLFDVSIDDLIIGDREMYSRSGKEQNHEDVCIVSIENICKRNAEQRFGERLRNYYGMYSA